MASDKRSRRPPLPPENRGGAEGDFGLVAGARVLGAIPRWGWLGGVNYPGVCDFSQSRNASFMRVCQRVD